MYQMELVGSESEGLDYYIEGFSISGALVTNRQKLLALSSLVEGLN